jgi:hypothetical protein
VPNFAILREFSLEVLNLLAEDIPARTQNTPCGIEQLLLELKVDGLEVKERDVHAWCAVLA